MSHDTTPDPYEWHSGPPPHVGWWQVEAPSGEGFWRWWDGRKWSDIASYKMTAAVAARRAQFVGWPFGRATFRWRHLYPANARVPRVDPRKQ